jgi:hypothetical protein
VDQIERRLNASARFLDYGGRLQLVNSVLSTLPNHYLGSLKIHKSIIKIADRSRRHCLWAKEDGAASVQSLAAWDLVCRPKRRGGLGIINFEIQNTALLLKQLHKFYRKADVPWVNLVWSLYSTDAAPHAQSKRGSFWWRDVFSLVEIYRSITSSKIGAGDSVLFWKDYWHDNHLLCDTFPRLFSYTLNQDVTVAEMVRSNDPFDQLVLPISVQAHSELTEVQLIMQQVDVEQGAIDARTFPWGSAEYTSAKFYNFMFEALPSDTAFNAIWKSKCLPKLRVFAWLLFMDRLNTKDMMQRKNWNLDEGHMCVLCDQQTLETRDHLFFQCNFAASCWEKVGIQWDCSLNISDRFTTAKQSFAKPCFMEIAICTAWNIWKERNDYIFKNQDPSLARWGVRFRSDLMMHQYRVKASLVQPLLDWIFSSFI